MAPKGQHKCEAIYGDTRCENLANTIVVSNSQMFSLCKECAKLEKKQQKYN